MEIFNIYILLNLQTSQRNLSRSNQGYNHQLRVDGIVALLETQRQPKNDQTTLSLTHTYNNYDVEKPQSLNKTEN